MRSFLSFLSIAVFGGATALAVGNAQAQFQVKKAADSCRNAHALLVASRSGQHGVVWREIRRTLAKRPHDWQVVDDYEPGVSQRVSLRQYETRYSEGGSAYVVHCGHGGTCNSLAETFFADHPTWGSVEVFCGGVPDILANPQPPQ